MADNSIRIAEIREILATGGKRTASDGSSVEWDLDSLRKELRRLIATDDSLRGRRPVVSTVNLGHGP